MTENRSYKIFVWVAFILAGVTLVLLVIGHFANKAPGEIAYQAGNTYFTDGRYLKAKSAYLEALQANPNLTAAYAGLANTLVQLKDFREALRFIDEAISIDGKFGGYYATRGIVYDHLGVYEKAIIDYEKAVLLTPEVAEGMGWIDRFFYKMPKAPPTVADRLAYLKAQMKLPAKQRVLRLPELDAKQKPYDQ